MIKKGTAMKCPTCKIMIQKTAGCDGMMCSCCKVVNNLETCVYEF